MKKILTFIFILASLFAVGQKQVVNRGTPNGHNGDTPYVMAGKIIHNFDELFDSRDSIPPVLEELMSSRDSVAEVLESLQSFRDSVTAVLADTMQLDDAIPDLGMIELPGNTTANILATTPTEGTIIFDRQTGKLCLYYDGEWYELNMTLKE